jgi:hypothetical protein
VNRDTFSEIVEDFAGVSRARFDCGRVKAYDEYIASPQGELLACIDTEKWNGDISPPPAL